MKNEVICPHCGHKWDTDELYEDGLYDICPNEEYKEIECGGCEKTLVVKGSYSPEYETFKTMDDYECS